jgi:nitrite reductase (NO-forming)
MLETKRGHRDWLAIVAVVAVFLLVIGTTSVVVSSASSSTATPSAAPAGAVQVELGEMYVKPAVIEWQKGKVLRVSVLNKGKMAHDLKLDGKTGTRMLQPGETQEVEWGPFDVDADAWCTVPGHKDDGMSMHIHVSDAGPETHAANTTGSGEQGVRIDPNASPAVGWAARDARLAPASAEREHRITLSASEKVIEVAPGVRQEMWTFGDTVPGPTLRGKVGDTFIITLRNDGKVAHSIDFHASKVAWNDEMRNIAPGESLEYRFIAKHSGAFMYHCGTAPALHHIGNGMYGAIIIDPAELAPVDHEFAFVQSELYTGPQDGTGSLAKMKNEQWDAVVFNGYFNQYAFNPIRVEAGQRVRAWVVDAGPSENSAFHVVGSVFDTVFKEGAYTLRRGSDGGAQALDLQPSQGGFVEFTFDENGEYPFVTHKFANAGKGAMGMFQVGPPKPAAAVAPAPESSHGKHTH